MVIPGINEVYFTLKKKRKKEREREGGRKGGREGGEKEEKNNCLHFSQHGSEGNFLNGK